MCDGADHDSGLRNDLELLNRRRFVGIFASSIAGVGLAAYGASALPDCPDNPRPWITPGARGNTSSGQ